MVNPSPNVQTFPPVTPAELAAHTEQALVELVYVGTGNQMLGGALNNLSSALNTTQSVLNILQNLQNLHNQISVKSKSAFNFNYKFGPSGALTVTNTVTTIAAGQFRNTTRFQGNITAYQRIYNSAASAYFGLAINPFFAFASSTASGYPQFLSAIKTLKSTLSKEIQTLSAQTPASTVSNPNGLLATIKKVFNELPSNFNFVTVQNWVLDNYVSHGSVGAAAGGAIQNDISTAITAAQNLNDTQKEQVRRYLFIFQEYYQSASAILSSMTQIIQQMAQKISQ